MAENPAPNAYTHAVTDYAPDPHGWATFGALTRRIAGTLNGARPMVDRSPTWHGWTQAPQQFRGAAALGRARPLSQRSPTMQEQNTGQTVASAIWTDRASRGL